MLKKLPLILSSMIIAIILFQSALIAPAINALLNEQETAILLRFIWPKFFILIALLAGASIVSLLMLKPKADKRKFYMGATLILMLLSYFITPTINQAKDTGNDQLWSMLHIVTVSAAAVVLGLNFLSLKESKYSV
jgi:fucose 4-O-acetylase-like acetyltransferase